MTPWPVLSSKAVRLVFRVPPQSCRARGHSRKGAPAMSLRSAVHAARCRYTAIKPRSRTRLLRVAVVVPFDDLRMSRCQWSRSLKKRSAKTNARLSQKPQQPRQSRRKLHQSRRLIGISLQFPSSRKCLQARDLREVHALSCSHVESLRSMSDHLFPEMTQMRLLFESWQNCRRFHATLARDKGCEEKLDRVPEDAVNGS